MISKSNQPNSELASLPSFEVPSYAENVERRVNIEDGKVTLPALAPAVEAGEEVIIARSGEPLMKLVPLVPGEKLKLGTQKKIRRKLGYGRKYAPDFTWEQWEEAERDLQKIFKTYGYMD